MGSNKPLLQVENLKTYFYVRRGVVKAVDGVSFSLAHGETLGIVGESGCGKTITCLSILRAVPEPAGKIVGGRILLDGENLLEKSSREIQRIRGKSISIILQDPLTSLNPAFSIGNQVGETIGLHQKVKGSILKERVIESLRMVKIPAADSRVSDYPHQMSGGMRQRVVGAMALSCQPKLLIADEPTTSLDVTIQAQYLELLRELQKQTGVALIFVTHDFGIVAAMCHRVAVMYAGRIVEMGPTRELFHHPCHPYTRALMNCLPRLEVDMKRLAHIDGQPPDLCNLAEGCSFRPRCPDQDPKCKPGYPDQVRIAPDHLVACWKYAE